MKKNVYKKLLSLAICFVLCLSAFPLTANGAEMLEESVSLKNVGLTQNQKNILNRADYLYSITWVAQKTITAHAYSYYYTYYAGNTYHLPYGQGATSHYIGYGVSPEGFRAAAADANSIFYSQKSYTGSWYSTYYISDCSGFVSWCWGLTAKQSTRSLANVSSYVASVTTNNIKNYLQIGDALNRYDYHVVLVTDIKYDSAGNMTEIEITEQAVPETMRTVYTPAGLASAYSSYDGIYRYNGTVPPSPVVIDEETWQEKACFDADVYRSKYEDLKNLNDEQLKDHWINHGIKEGRCASAILDLKYYAEQNEDVTNQFGTDYEKIYEHFVTYGYKEHTKSSRVFDGQYYCDNNPDVVANYKESYLLHYIEHGMKEGRRASLLFDVDYYLVIRPDVAEMWKGDFVAATEHYASHGVNEGVVGYDSQPPVISDVVFSNISSAGYTVTCKVTDNWGISFVSFPTWTVANDQDDLAADFLNTQQGTKNGDTYTFYVKASEHNNETGLYVTHIYAEDLGGNRVSVSPDAFEVKDGAKDIYVGKELISEIILVDSSSYLKEENRINNVPSLISVDTFLKEFKNENLKVKDANENVISGTSVVGTGAVVELYDGETLVDSAVVVVLGDIDGNGVIDTTDYLRVKSAFLEAMKLGDAQTIAADVDGNGTIDGTDYMRIKGHFLGTFEI